MLFSSISFWDDALAITIKTTRESVPSNIYYKMWTLVCRFFEGHSIFSCISIIMSSNIFSPKYLLKATIFFFASRLLVWFALVAPCCDPYQRKTIIFQNRNNFMVRMILGIFGHPNSSSASENCMMPKLYICADAFQEVEGGAAGNSFTLGQISF